MNRTGYFGLQCNITSEWWSSNRS